MDTGIAQRGENVVTKGVRVLTLQFMGAFPDVLKHLSRGETAGCPNRNSGGDSALESGDPNHEEFVEIARKNGKEFRPLEARKGLVLGELEYPLVERQPGKLSVEESICRQVVGLHLTMFPQRGERLPTNRGVE